MDKKLLIKFNTESSPQEIWIRIFFLEINGSPSLILSRAFLLVNIILYLIGGNFFLIIFVSHELLIIIIYA